jgi:hypothetical protein
MQRVMELVGLECLAFYTETFVGQPFEVQFDWLISKGKRDDRKFQTLSKQRSTKAEKASFALRMDRPLLER